MANQFKDTNDVSLRLSAQRALWGNIPPSLRSVSVEYNGTIILFQCIFDKDLSDYDKELLSYAATEIISDFSEPYTINENFLTINYPEKMHHLKNLVYLRYEK